MGSKLIRMVRRRTILEIDDPEAVLEAGFATPDGLPDLNVSTYLVDSGQTVQTRTEHCAGNGLDRPSSCANVDLSGLCEDKLESTNANEWFSHANESHHELRFHDREDLLDFIGRLLKVREGRVDDVTAADCKAYVREMRRTEDEEWMHFFRNHAKGPKWKARFGGAPSE